MLFVLCSRVIRERAEVPFASSSSGRRGYGWCIPQWYTNCICQACRAGRINCIRDSDADAARVQVICHHYHGCRRRRRRRRRCYPRGDDRGTGSHSPDGLRLITPVRDVRMVRCHSLRTARAVVPGCSLNHRRDDFRELGDWDNKGRDGGRRENELSYTVFKTLQL